MAFKYFNYTTFKSENIDLCLNSMSKYNIEPFKYLPDNLKDEFLLILAGLTGGTLYFIAENTALEITQNGNAVRGISFTNTYKATPADVELSGNKTLVGKDLAGGQFSFELYSATEEYKEISQLQTAFNGHSPSPFFENLPLPPKRKGHCISPGPPPPRGSDSVQPPASQRSAYPGSRTGPAPAQTCA